MSKVVNTFNVCIYSTFCFICIFIFSFLFTILPLIGEEDGDICQWAWEIVKCFDKADPILVYGWIPNEEGAEIPKKPEADGNEDDEDDLI